MFSDILFRSRFFENVFTGVNTELTNLTLGQLYCFNHLKIDNN